ncbi:6517_t:CDS:2, partial [Cetraspora pellucida]
NDNVIKSELLFFLDSVSSAHVGVFRIIKKLQKEQNQIELNIEAILRGMPKPAQ